MQPLHRTVFQNHHTLSQCLGTQPSVKSLRLVFCSTWPSLPSKAADLEQLWLLQKFFLSQWKYFTLELLPPASAPTPWSYTEPVWPLASLLQRAFFRDLNVAFMSLSWESFSKLNPYSCHNPCAAWFRLSPQTFFSRGWTYLWTIEFNKPKSCYKLLSLATCFGAWCLALWTFT